MISKEIEAFQKAVKHFNIARSITMMIFSVTILSYLVFDRFQILSYDFSINSYSIFDLLMIMQCVALVIIISYSFIRYIKYFIALKAVCSINPDDLFTKIYRLEMIILKIIIGSLITCIFVLLVLLIIISSDFYSNIILFLIPLSLIIILVLFSRSFIETIPFLLGSLISYIEDLVFLIKYGSSSNSAYLSFDLPVILLFSIFLCMSILIVTFQFRLNQVFFSFKKFIGVQITPLRFKEMVFTFDFFHYLEFSFHILAGLIVSYIFIQDLNNDLFSSTRFNLSLIPIVMYFIAAVIVHIDARTWTNMIPQK